MILQFLNNHVYFLPYEFFLFVIPFSEGFSFAQIFFIICGHHFKNTLSYVTS